MNYLFVLPPKQKDQDFFLIGILFLLIIFSFSIRNFIFYLLVPIAGFFMINTYINFQKIIILTCLSLGFVLITQYTEYSFINFFVQHSKLHWSENICKFIDSNHSPLTASFLKLFLLNKKDDFSMEFYNQLISMTIVYMIVIGGLQMSLLRKIFSIFTNNKIILSILMIFVSGSYMLILNFNPSVTRVFFYNVLRIFFRNTNKMKILASSGIIILFLSPDQALKFGFTLSFLCTFIVFFSSDFIVSKSFKRTKINFITTIATLPFTIAMGSKFSPFFLIFTGFVSFVLFFIYLWSIFTFLIIIFSPITNVLFFYLKSFIQELSYINISMGVKSNHPVYFVLYFYVYFLVIIFLYRKNDNNNYWSWQKHNSIQINSKN